MGENTPLYALDSLNTKKICVAVLVYTSAYIQEHMRVHKPITKTHTKYTNTHKCHFHT